MLITNRGEIDDRREKAVVKWPWQRREKKTESMVRETGD